MIDTTVSQPGNTNLEHHAFRQPALDHNNIHVNYAIY